MKRVMRMNTELSTFDVGFTDEQKKILSLALLEAYNYSKGNKTVKTSSLALRVFLDAKQRVRSGQWSFKS